MSDEYEQARRARLAEINAAPVGREALQDTYGRVWDTQELTRDFEVVGYVAPLVVVRRRADGLVGSMEFQHDPRFYFGFEVDRPETTASCAWCHASVPAAQANCPTCAHQARVPRLECRCPACVGGGRPEPLSAAELEAALDRLRRRGFSE